MQDSFRFDNNGIGGVEFALRFKIPFIKNLHFSLKLVQIPDHPREIAYFLFDFYLRCDPASS